MIFAERIVHPADILVKRWDEVQGRFGKPKEISLKNLPSLDNKLWGFERKKMVVVGARPSQGKSTFLLNASLEFVRQGLKVLFFSFEMTKEVCLDRIISKECLIDNSLIRCGDVIRYRYRVSNFYEELKKWRLLIVETIGNSLPDFKKIQNAMHDKPDVVVIDYGNMVAERPGRTKKETFDEYIKGLRALSVQENFLLIMAAQINRSAVKDGKAREPRLDDLKETGVLEEVSDIVILLHWQWFYDRIEGSENEYTVDIAKNRDGRTGKVNALFYPQYSLIQESCVYADRDFDKRQDSNH